MIEAFQITEETRWNNEDWPEWLHMAWNMEPSEVGSVDPLNMCPPELVLPEGAILIISTLEGKQVVMENDFIIRGVQGELYPCKPDIFWQTYEEM